MHSIENTYPLIFHVCPSCLLAQTEQYRDGYEIFSDDYVYFSSCSNYWLEHAKQYVELIIKKLNLTKGSFVLEIASNDGYLLTNFVEKNIECLGVEPTKSTAIEAVKKGVKTLVEFFNVKTSKNIVADFGKADLIIANNVLAHVPDINDFVSALKGVLKDDGVVTIEVPHVLKLIEKSEFDTIYHEHLSYFSILPLLKLVKQFGLEIFDIRKQSVHGGTLRIFVSKKDNYQINNSVNFFINEENKLGLDKIEFYHKFSTNVEELKKNLLKLLTQLKKENKSLLGYGAPAKGNVLLNYCGIDTNFLDYIVDTTPLKQGKYTPGTHIPIIPPTTLKNVDVALLLAWNYESEILLKENIFRKNGGKFLIPLPKPIIK